jgi:hypothetical protein
MMGSLEGRRAKEGKAAKLNTFSSKGQEVGDPLCQGLILGVLGELFLELKG